MLEMPIVGQAVGAGNRRLHGADDDTVGKSDIAQLQGAEQHRRAARRRVMGGMLPPPCLRSVVVARHRGADLLVAIGDHSRR
jgi:hypothetical protein